MAQKLDKTVKTRKNHELARAWAADKLFPVISDMYVSSITSIHYLQASR
jgi:hypothetical protein